jgi:hypothetical protein
MAASDDVTEALRRTTRLMQQELERSVLSVQMLGRYIRVIKCNSMNLTQYLVQ